MTEWKDWQGKHPYYKQGFADGYNEGIGEALKPQVETAQRSSCPAITIAAPTGVVTAVRSDLARKVLEVVEAQKYGIPEDDGVEFCLTALRELFEREGVEV